MSTFGQVLYSVLLFFFILLIIRVVMETVFNFARSYEPHGPALLILEFTFTVTDPPIKALRRVIPPLRLGQMSLGLAEPVLFIIVIVLMQVAGSL